MRPESRSDARLGRENAAPILGERLKYNKLAMGKHRKELLKSRWKQEWSVSPSASRIMAVDSTLPLKKFLKLIIDERVTRLDASHIFQLRSGRISLNIYLDRFKRRKVPSMRPPEGKRAALQIRLPSVQPRVQVTAQTTQGEGTKARRHLEQQ